MSAAPFIYHAVRTPRGRMRKDGGTLAGVAPHELFAGLLRELAARGVPPESVDDVLAGASTVAREQAPGVARVAVMAAGWPDTVPAGTVSRMCTSGLDALAQAAGQVASGMADVMVAGGVESMSRVPMFADKPAVALDAAAGDLSGFVQIGVSADFTAAKHGFTREELDAWAVRSHSLAAAAPDSENVVPVLASAAGPEEMTGEAAPTSQPPAPSFPTTELSAPAAPGRALGTTILLSRDEGARPSTTAESLAALAPLFGDDPGWERIEARFPGFHRPPAGLHTVATAPQMCDGASAAVIGNAEAAQTLGRDPVGRIVSWAYTAVKSPGLDGTAAAARKALDRGGVSIGDIAVAEFNESFSVTPLLLLRELGIAEDRVNVHGGALAVGHPLGASGGIILANALDELSRRGGGYGLLVIPAALGISMAMVIERTA